MSKKRIRLDEEDLIVLLGDALRAGGFMEEDAEILGFEYKTRTIKRGGDYYDDVVKPGDPDLERPEAIEIIKWIKVLTDTKQRKREPEPEEEAQSEDVQESGEAK